MQIVKRTMGWIQKPSAWQYQQSLNAKRKAQAQTYLNQTSALSTSIFSVTDTFSHDMTALVLQNVVKRVSSEAQEKAKEALPEDLLSSLSASLDKTA